MALPDAPLDYSGAAEARLRRAGGSPYLREVWRSPHWRLFAVAAPARSAAPRTPHGVGVDSFTLAVPARRRYEVRVRFTPYWALAAGTAACARARGLDRRCDARAAGRLQVGIGFSLARVFDHGPRCA